MADAEPPGPPFTQKTPVKDNPETITLESPPILTRKRKRRCENCTRLKQLILEQVEISKKHCLKLIDFFDEPRDEQDEQEQEEQEEQKKEEQDAKEFDVRHETGGASLDLTYDGTKSELLPVARELQQLCALGAPEELIGQARAERNKTRAKQLRAARAAESGTPPRRAAPSP